MRLICVNGNIYFRAGRFQNNQDCWNSSRSSENMQGLGAWSCHSRCNAARWERLFSVWTNADFYRSPSSLLTARGEDEDKLKGLGLGADDYMVKPFLPKELSLRIGIILRRYYKGEVPVVQLAGSQIDFDRAEVIKEINISRWLQKNTIYCWRSTAMREEL